MNIHDIGSPNVHVTYPQRPLVEAARALRDQNIGALVVIDPLDPERRPIGILTDRDIVRGQVTKAQDLYCLTVEDVMSPRPLCLPVDMGLAEATDAMNGRAVRRAPMVDRHGSLAGIVTMDDLLPAVAAELQELAALINDQARNARRSVPGPAQPGGGRVK